MKTRQTHRGETIARIAKKLHTDTDTLRRTLIAAAVQPSAVSDEGALYDSDTASFLWIAKRTKESPTKTLRTNTAITSQPR